MSTPRQAQRDLRRTCSSPAGPLAGIALLAGSLWAAQSGTPQNVLVVILDDVGVDQVGTYATNPGAAHTPTLDALAAHGVLFRNAWSHPVCSPTRLAVSTGRHARDTGCGTSVEWGHDYDPSEELVTLAELAPASTAWIGKWHMSSQAPDGFSKPVSEHGWDRHVGPIRNLGELHDYYTWLRNVAVDGQLPATQALSTTYTTTHNVDDALAFVAEARPPWLLVLAFTAAHKPWHDPPPPELHSIAPLDDDTQRYRASIAALDTELGRLLETLDLDATTVLVLGDNGVPPAVNDGAVPEGHAKGTVYQGGVHVPLIVAGGSVARPGRVTDALVQDLDLFPTVLELLDVVPPASDGVSLLPYLADPHQPSLRTTVYTETFEPNGAGPYTRHDWAIRDRGHKLVSRNGHHELYALAADPDELHDLLRGVLTPVERAAYQALLQAALALQAR